MKAETKSFDNRILFFDHIRYFLVLLVVVLHAACSYSFYTNWWPVNDANAYFFDYVLRFLGVFLMPGLFFIAGYFALPSLHKKNTWLFIKKKFKRLGIPWLIGVMTLGPIRDYIHQYSRYQEAGQLWNTFLFKMRSAFSLKIGAITSTWEFGHLHFWFISLLLFFFIVFAMLHKGQSKLFPNAFSSESSKFQSHKSILLILFFVAVISTALTLLMHQFFSQGSGREPWITIAGLLQFQPTRLVHYILCFILGIFAFHRKWFVNGKAPGHFALWIVLSVVLWIGMERALTILLIHVTPFVATMYILSRTLLFFSILLALISIGVRFWDSSSTINRSLADNSYNIYIVHMIFVYLIQLLLLNWLELSIYFKFVFVSLSAIALSYLFSNFLVKPFPRTSAVGVIGLFTILLVFLGS